MPGPPLATGAIDVVWARPRRASALRSALRSVLDGGELQRMNALRNQEDRDRFVTAHALLRLVVAEWTGLAAGHLEFTANCTRCGAPHGKPALLLGTEPTGLEISLAHAGQRVMVAVTTAGPVGVDVEPHAAAAFPGFEEIALSPVERQQLKDTTRTPRCRAIAWVRKEAALKATGHGLRSAPSDIVVSPPDRPAELIAWNGPDPPAAPVQLTDLDAGAGYAACVALIAHRRVQVSLRDGNDLLSTASGPARESR